MGIRTLNSSCTPPTHRRSAPVERPWPLRADLERTVGAVEKPTHVDDLDMPSRPLPAIAPSGVVARLDRPQRMRAVQAAAAASGDPYYVKLRPEADPALIGSGSGELCLGFFVDAIYRVRWNSLVEAGRVEVTASDGVVVTPPTGVGPDVGSPSDVDPREFLVTVTGARASTTLAIAIHYHGRRDDQGWRRAITRRYAVRLTPDTVSGRVMAGGRPGLPSGMSPFRRDVAPDIARVVDLLFAADEDGDVRLSRDEAPLRFRAAITAIDTNGDGHIAHDEASARMSKRIADAP